MDDYFASRSYFGQKGLDISKWLLACMPRSMARLLLLHHVNFSLNMDFEFCAEKRE